MKAHQGGAALIVSLVLLVIALLLGLSSAQSSRLEETMAGNQRAASLALMAAEYAGAEAWEQFDPDNLGSKSDQPITGLNNVRYDWSVEREGFGSYSLTGIGNVRSGTNNLAKRVIEYQAFLSIGPGGTIVAANNGEDCIEESVAFIPPSSNLEITGEEEVDGNIKAAIQVGCGAIAKNMVSEIIPNSGGFEDHVSYDSDSENYSCKEGGGNNRLCNYYGGVQGEIDTAILKDANKLAEFVFGLKEYFSGSVVSEIPDHVPEDSITFVSSGSELDQGRVTFESSGNFSGGGLLIVEGNVKFSGVPSFNGLIIVLGDYVVSGGGGGEFRGSVVSAPLVDDSCWSDGVGSNCAFDDKKLEIGGGGSSSYSYDPVSVLNAFSLVDEAGLNGLWGADGISLKTNYYMAYWNEKIAGN